MTIPTRVVRVCSDNPARAREEAEKRSWVSAASPQESPGPREGEQGQAGAQGGGSSPACPGVRLWPWPEPSSYVAYTDDDLSVLHFGPSE